MRTKILLLTLVSVFCISSVSGQKKEKVSKITITGTVVDEAKNPIPNAMIMIDDQKSDIVTDEKGNYKIKVKPDAQKIMIFTFSHGVKEEFIAGRTLIDFNFGPGKVNAATEQEIPSSETSAEVGYGSIKKKNITNQAYIKDPNVRKKTYSSVYDMLQEIPGVRVNRTTVIIQDSKNLWGPVPPLFVVDGVPVNDLTNVTPTQVESISVLKGASAAMYGSRGFGGVIVVKTKKIDIDK